LNSPKISVVVPVYNVEKYLRRCLDSIVNQTFRDFELICVNDESPDNSLEILREYEERDDRIVIIDQKNTGASIARNNAFNAARGEYVICFDGDDWVDLDTLEVLYNEITSENADIVIFSYVREYEGRAIKKNIFPQDKIIFLENECKNLQRFQVGLINEELENPENADAICSAWSNLYKLEIIRSKSLAYVDMKIIGTFEDGLFNIEYYEYVKKAVYINKHFYHYFKGNESSLTTRYRHELLEKWDNLFEILEKYITDRKLPLDYYEALNNRIAFSIIGIGLNLISSNLSFSKKMHEISLILNGKKIRPAIKNLKIKYLPIHWKAFFVCCKYRINFMVFLLLFLINILKKM